MSLAELAATARDLAVEGIASFFVERVESGTVSAVETDRLAVEEPLDIRLIHGPERKEISVAVTMRTPGQDLELAVGFLRGEGILSGRHDMEDVESDGPYGGDRRNLVRVILEPGASFDPGHLRRRFLTTSSSGDCGETSIAALETVEAPDLSSNGPMVSAGVLHGLPEKLGRAQRLFEQTGGLHAAALFDLRGELLAVREDVGRHNALDKLVGSFLLQDRLPLTDQVLLVSGRASFDLVWKAVMAGIPIMAAVGAPSSLAVDLARSHEITLAGFVRERRFNLYCGRDRIT